MTENNIPEDDVIGDLHEEEEIGVEEMTHDPANAPKQEVDAAKKASKGKGKAPRGGKGTASDSGKGDSMQKVAVPKGQDGSIDDKGAMPFKEGRMTKAGMINAAYQKMNTLNKEELTNLFNKVMNEDLDDTNDAEVTERPSIDVDHDFSSDINALVNDEATLSEEFKGKVQTIFEAAVNTKLSEEIDRLEEKYEEELQAEISETKNGLVDKVDSYLNYVVENWMDENKLAVQSGLRTEIAEKFMNNLKDLFTESYIDVPESKVDLVDELAQEVEELEEQLNNQTGQSIAMQEELEGYKREAVIREASRDLAETQIDKLKSLTNNIDFEDEETFIDKVSTVKESYFKKGAVKSEIGELEEDTDDNTVETSGSMANYLTALKSQIKN